MTQMICANCGRYGIAWHNLTGWQPFTVCPHCKGMNCQIPEERPREEDDEDEAAREGR